MSSEVSQDITQKSGSNLALAFVLLPPERREAMSALYAFCREVDDVADEEERPEEERARALASWREDIRLACLGGEPRFPVNRELQPFIQKYGLHLEHFEELITGMESDLTVKTHPDMASLELYCYRAASVVGLLSIPIFGCRNPASEKYAVALGKALQLTNILRDVGNDAERGRIYLPGDWMERHGVRPEDILEGRHTPEFETLAAEVAEHATNFYEQARSQITSEDRKALATSELMGAVYWRLLTGLQSRRFHVLGRPELKLSKAKKLSIVLQAWLRMRLGISGSLYGSR